MYWPWDFLPLIRKTYFWFQELLAAKCEIQSLAALKTEQELTLEEMGTQLSVSKLQLIDLKEDRDKSLKSNAKWAKDSTVNECHACHTAFNLTKRKVKIIN